MVLSHQIIFQHIPPMSLIRPLFHLNYSVPARCYFILEDLMSVPKYYHVTVFRMFLTYHHVFSRKTLCTLCWTFAAESDFAAAGASVRTSYFIMWSFVVMNLFTIP